VQTRFTPALTFVLDEGVKKSLEVTRLINEALGPKPSEPVSEDTEPEEPSEGSTAPKPAEG